MIHISSVRDWAIVTCVKSWITSKRVSYLLSAAVVVATWGSAHAETISGTLNNFSPTMDGRVGTNLIERTCAAIKDYPGETPGEFRYATHTFTNTGPFGCVTFKVISYICEGLNSGQLSIYAGSFNPANKAANYYGDTGDFGAGQEMSVLLGPGDTVTLVVTELFSSSGSITQCSYVILADTTPAAHEFGGDGTSDILWRNASTGTVALWRMNGATVIGTQSLGSVPAEWSIVGQRDFDANARDDLLWRNTTTGAVAVWFLTATGGTLLELSTANVGTVPTNWSIVGTGASLHFGGIVNLLWRDTSGNTAIWSMIRSLVWQTASLGRVPTAWSVAAFADFDGDGRADILWRNTSTGQTAIWFINGVTVTSTAVIGTIPTAWSIVATGDLNGDSMADIVWRDTSGNVAIWLMNGASILQTGSLGAVPTNWVIVETGDFEGNGKADILWRDINTGTVAIWFMNGLVVASTTNLGAVPSDWVIQNVNVN
jgi:FG-GAP-like repeat